MGVAAAGMGEEVAGTEEAAAGAGTEEEAGEVAGAGAAAAGVAAGDGDSVSPYRLSIMRRRRTTILRQLTIRHRRITRRNMELMVTVATGQSST